MTTEPLPLSYWAFMAERMDTLSLSLLPLRARDLDQYENPGQALAEYYAPSDDGDIESYVENQQVKELAEKLGVGRLEVFRERIGWLGLDSAKAILDIQWQLRTLPTEQVEGLLRAASTKVSAAELQLIAHFISNTTIANNC